MSSIEYHELGDRCYVSFRVGGQERQIVLPNNRELRESLDRVINQQR